MTLNVYIATILCLQICSFQAGVAIYPCKDSKVTVFEDSPATFACRDVPSSVGVRWGLDHISKPYVEIGRCENNGACEVLHSNQVYNFSRSPEGTESRMTIWRDVRKFEDLSVVCRINNSEAGRKSCSLIIKSRPVIDKGTCGVSVTNRSVTSRCYVTHGYSADGRYRCIWERNGIQQNFEIPTEIKPCEKNGVSYMCWFCSFTQPLPSEGGTYTYTISTDPPPVREYSGNISIGEPHRASTAGLSNGVVIAGIVSPAIKIIVVITAIIVLTLRNSNSGPPDNSDEEGSYSTMQVPPFSLSRFCSQARRQTMISSSDNGVGHEINKAVELKDQGHEEENPYCEIKDLECDL